MVKLTKRVVDGLESDGSKHGALYWDTELKGFGVRVFSTGLKTFVVKFRTRSGRQRWLKIGAFGPMTVEQARDRAMMELAKVIGGEDPADNRDQLRAAVTVAQLCDHYMTAAGAGLVLGRKGTPKKARTLSTDRSRIDAHVKPVLGQLKAREVTRADIEMFKAAVVTGKTARDQMLGFRRRSIVKGGKGALTRTLGILGAIFAWGQDNGYVENNPVRGVKRFADAQKKALLTAEQYRALALTLDALDDKRDRKDERAHSAVGLSAIRFIALTGVRRGECQNLKWVEVDSKGTCIALGETKTGPSLRPLSRAAFAIIEKQDAIADFVFPAGPETQGYQGLPGLWRTVQRTARVAAEAAAEERGEPAPKSGPLDGVTLHSLRHSFAGIAEELGATIPTIAALLGHRVGGVTGGYILKRVDVLLIDAANRVADHIEKLMRGEAPPSSVVQFVPRGRITSNKDAHRLALVS
jgi:integrase